MTTEQPKPGLAETLALVSEGAPNPPNVGPAHYLLNSQLAAALVAVVRAADPVLKDLTQFEGECGLCHWTADEDQPHAIEGAYLGRTCPVAALDAALAALGELVNTDA